MHEFHQSPAMRQRGWFWFFRSNWGSEWASLLSVCRPVDPDCCTLFCGFMSEVIWAAALPWPPHLRLAERRSASLHLAQRFSDLISGRRAKGWRPWPDPPENGVCAKRFYSESGEKGATTGSAALLPDSAMTTQQAPALLILLCVMKSV